MESLCCICRGNWGEVIEIPGSNFSPPLKGNMIFYVCKQCMEEGVCPQCVGKGERFMGKLNAPGETKMCDLCGGSGKFDYSVL